MPEPTSIADAAAAPVAGVGSLGLAGILIRWGLRRRAQLDDSVTLQLQAVNRQLGEVAMSLAEMGAALKAADDRAEARAAVLERALASQAAVAAEQDKRLDAMAERVTWLEAMLSLKGVVHRRTQTGEQAAVTPP